MPAIASPGPLFFSPTEVLVGDGGNGISPPPGLPWGLVNVPGQRFEVGAVCPVFDHEGLSNGGRYPETMMLWRSAAVEFGL